MQECSTSINLNLTKRIQFLRANNKDVSNFSIGTYKFFIPWFKSQELQVQVTWKPKQLYKFINTFVKLHTAKKNNKDRNVRNKMNKRFCSSHKHMKNKLSTCIRYNFKACLWEQKHKLFRFFKENNIFNNTTMGLCTKKLACFYSTSFVHFLTVNSPLRVEPDYVKKHISNL